MAFALGNAQHQGDREAQQDSFGFSQADDSQFLLHAGVAAVVADGMGGLAHGDAASRMAVRSFLSAYAAKTRDEAITDALRRCMNVAQQYVCETASQLGAGEEIGTTLAAVVLRDQELYWIAAGDSAIFLVRNGRLRNLPQPHVYARELDQRVSSGEISTEDALRDPQRESLTSYLGVRGLTAVDANTRPLILGADDCVLLASDGLFKTLSESEILAALEGSMQQRCEALVRATIAKGLAGQDNVTVLAMALDEEPVAPAVVLPQTKRLRPMASGLRLLAISLVTLGCFAAGFLARPFVDAWRATRTATVADAAKQEKTVVKDVAPAPVQPEPAKSEAPKKKKKQARKP